jgi:RNA polymerase sigma factor (sigma-70 family)
VLQDVFTSAHAAMLRDDRKINVRPWLYRIARNRCLNHMRRPVPEGQDSMDVLPHGNGTTTAEHVQMREDLRQLLADVETLPETQRTALLLREIDQLSYEEIAQAMQTTVPSVKSLLVRARIGLAESGQARMLTCDEVQVSLAEAAEGLSKLDGPARKHVRGCDACGAFRDQLRSDRKAMAALFPVGLVALFKGSILAKVFGSGTAGSGAVGSGAVGSGAVGSAGAASGGLGGISLLGGAIGAKAAAGFATAAILTAGAVEVRNLNNGGNEGSAAQPAAAAVTAPAETTSHPALADDTTPPFAPAANPATRDRPADRVEPNPPANPPQPAVEPSAVPEAADEAAPVDGEGAAATTDEDEVALGVPGTDPDTGAAPVSPPPAEPSEPQVTPPAPAPTPPATPAPPATPPASGMPAPVPPPTDPPAAS